MTTASGRRRGYFDKSALRPAVYYRKVFAGQLAKVARDGWIKTRCCFHAPDENPSLSVNLTHGGFKCFSCGAKGDLIDFHMRRHKLSFVEAARSFGAWREAAR